jgi:hypothetical protein
VPGQSLILEGELMEVCRRHPPSTVRVVRQVRGGRVRRSEGPLRSSRLRLSAVDRLGIPDRRSVSRRLEWIAKPA